MDRRKVEIVKLCKLAHLDKKEIQRRLPSLGYKFIDFFNVDGLQGYVAECEKGQVLIFRESDSIIKEPIDWIHNFMAWKEEYEGKLYHAGYLKLALDNFNAIFDKITDLNLVIGGFSLGGGMAEVVANILADTTGFNCWFANIDGAAVIAENGYTKGIHTINSNSPVPILTLALGFNHFGDLIYFTFVGNTYINPKRIIRRFDFIMETIEDILELSIGKIDFEHNLTVIDINYDNGMDKIRKVLDK